MPRILAIDWDRHEVRALLLQSGATGASVAGAWVGPLAAGGDSVIGDRVASQLATLLAHVPLGKVTTIVGVGRDHVQMKLLSLPPAPPEELPDLVRFQAEREFTALGDESELDFLPLVGDAQTPHQVLAVALSTAGLNEVRDLCQAIGLEPNRIALRACAAASCVRQAGVARSGEVVLVISPLADEADLTVLADGEVVLMRTVRLPEEEHAAERQQALAGEIRRTLAATRQQLTSRHVDRIYLCGHGGGSDGQAEMLAEELGLPVDGFDPADYAPAGLDKMGLAPEQTARLVAVLGMAGDEAGHLPPPIDFLHVRRPAERGRINRLHALAAGVIVLAAVASGLHLWRQASEPVRERDAALAELARLQPIVDQYEDVTSRAAAIDAWLATDVNWLDELKRLSERIRPEVLTSSEFPAAEDVVVRQLTLFRPANSTGGQIDVDALGKTAATAAVEQRLRGDRHVVAIGPARRDRSVPGYEFSFDLGVTVTRPVTPEGAAP